MTLRQLLRQHGITRSSELAKRVGISRQHAYLLWQGRQGLSRQMIYRISEATDIAPADLFLAERPMPMPQLKGRPPKRPADHPRKTQPADPRPERCGGEDGDLTLEPEVEEDV
jgi:transcriptional regulator with XRE-family HTH domain